VYLKILSDIVCILEKNKYESYFTSEVWVCNAVNVHECFDYNARVHENCNSVSELNVFMNVAKLKLCCNIVMFSAQQSIKLCEFGLSG
jgi:hypothetical protein